MLQNGVRTIDIVRNLGIDKHTVTAIKFRRRYTDILKDYKW